MDALAADGGPVVGRAQVILHVACARPALAAGHGPAELGEDLLHRLAHHVGQDVEAPCSIPKSESLQ